jgi:hypothetical protein
LSTSTGICRQIDSSFGLYSGSAIFGDMRMKSIIVAGAILLAGFVNPAFAGCGNPPSYLTQAQVNTILANNYACGQKSGAGAPGWNEKHSAAPGGIVVEQHKPGTADDENLGPWSTAAAASGRGTVTYTYGGGVAPVYEIATAANGNCNAGAGTCTTLPATYQFCGVAGGAPAVLNILVSAALPTLSGCPTNP